MSAPQVRGLSPYGLLGRKLSHSWSSQIHEQLGTAPYALHELEPQDLATFVREGDWLGLNVTIPYKSQAAALADERSPRVEALGVANTLLRRPDGTIYAENTDVLGFSHMLERLCRTRLGGTAAQVLAGRPVLVLGSGGASQAVQASLRDVGARVSVISRHGDDTYATLLEHHADAALVVNTTPVGMFPTCPASPLAEGTLERLGHLLGVLDVVYNPERTGICMEAERLGLPFDSGLAMLVSQAWHSSALWQGHPLDEALVVKIERKLRLQTQNIVFVGMPGVGKTTTGRALARMLGRPFVDLDAAIEAQEGESPAQIIRDRGEDAFRDVETSVTATYGGRSGLVIACGGGVVTRQRNYPLLHQNGTIVLLERPIDQLSTYGRPMSQDKGVERLAQERMPLYRAWADVTAACTGSPTGDAAEICGLMNLD